MFKRIALVLAVVVMFVMVASYVFADDKPVQKEKTTCVMKDGKCDKMNATCCDKAKTAGSCCTKTASQCPQVEKTANSTCKGTTCKASCPAQESCKALEGEKK